LGLTSVGSGWRGLVGRLGFVMRFPARADAENALRIARARALEAYATIEESLCVICADVLRAPPEYTGVLFFKIAAARARNRAVEDLIRKRFGATYNLYWNSLIKNLTPIDQERNEIVHWQSAEEVGYDGGVAWYEYKLTPPNIWDLRPTTPFKATENIEAFIAKCGFYSRSINIFKVIIIEDMARDAGERRTWLDIFQQAITYPPPDTHPLSPNYRGP
jgi:hypothetical protein